MYDLNAARLWARGRRPAEVKPDSAHALIDRVFMSYGLDPMQLTDHYGWLHLALGSAEGVVGVVEWQPGEFYLVVLAPILEVPSDPEALASLYKALLELNHDGTLGARFSIHDDVVYVGLIRPVRGLGEEEIEVTEAFDEGKAQTLLHAMRTLAQSAQLPDEEAG